MSRPIAVWGQSVSKASVSVLIAKNQLDEAENQLWTVLTEHPDQVWALDLLASVRNLQGRGPEGEALYRRVLALKPDDMQANQGLGELYQKAGKNNEAIDAFARVVSVSEADPTANLALAVLFAQKREFNESIAAVQRIPPSARPVELLTVLATDYFGVGEPDKIPGMFPAVALASKSHQNVLIDFALVLIANGYVEDAANVMERAKPPITSADYLHGLARVRLAQGRVREARSLLMSALKLRPKSVPILLDSAQLAGTEDRWEDMVGFLQRADKALPNRPEILIKLSLARLRTGNRAWAVATARRLNAIDPDSLDSQYVLAYSLAESDSAEEAEPIARKVSEARPNDLNSQLLRVIVDYKMGRLDDAKQALERSVALDPKAPDALYYSALIARHEGNLGLAQQQLEDVVQNHPGYSAAELELGMVYLQVGKPEQGRPLLERAVKANPSASLSHYQLGLAYARLGLQDLAKAEMNRYNLLREHEDADRKRQGATAQEPPTGRP